MPVRLRILAASPEQPGPTRERVVEIADGAGEIRLGRRADLEVELPFPKLSALHARIQRQGAGWALEDLGSRNGTWLGEERLGAGEPRPLAPGARFVLGDVGLVFDGPSEAAPDAAGTATIARRLVSDLFAASARAPVATIEVLSGTESGRRLALAAADRPYVTGRAPDCDLPLATDHVSREHASFTRRWDGVFVRDLASKNGVRVAEARIAAEHRLRDGDIIEVGPVTMRLTDPEDRYLREIESRVEQHAAAAAPAAPAPAPALSAAAAAPPGPGRSPARLATIVAATALLLTAAAALLLLLSS